MKSFSPYIEHLDNLILSIEPGQTNKGTTRSIAQALDGHAYRSLRKLVPIEKLRVNGAFFSSSKLARMACRTIKNTLTNESKLFDPACGIGDLLLGCIPYLPTKNSLFDTLKLWEKTLSGRDIHSEFIHAARLRLILAALSKHRFSEHINDQRLKNSFPELGTGCGLSDTAALESATHIITNPPFGLSEAPASCTWSRGQVNSAAVFFENYLRVANIGTRIIGILPDVLRSGSRYTKWRHLVENYSYIKRVEQYGRFDKWTDVDVFILEVEKRSNRNSIIFHRSDWLINHNVQPLERISDHFHIRTGPLVEYREPHKGQWRPFIHPRNTPPWSILKNVTQKRRYQGPVISSPFVVVRRTSRPDDRYRAVGTIVSSRMALAVENHLIILSPKDGTLRTCKKLLKVLRKEDTNKWLNQRICCRHLTVSALGDIPWIE